MRHVLLHITFSTKLHYNKIKSIRLQVVILSYTKKKIIHEPNQNCCVCANTSDGATTVLKLDRQDVEVWIFVFCFCCFKSLLSRAPDSSLPAQTPVSTLSSGCDEADSAGSTHRFTACSWAWQYGWSWGCVGEGVGYSKMARQFAITVRNRQETFNQLVRRRHDGTSRAPARQARLRHRSEMLSLHLWWHAKNLHHQG